MFTTASGPILGLSQPPMRSLPEAVSTWVKWREREADESLPYNGNIRKEWSYPPYISLMGCLYFRGQYRKVCSPRHQKCCRLLYRLGLLFVMFIGLAGNWN